MTGRVTGRVTERAPGATFRIAAGGPAPVAIIDLIAPAADTLDAALAMLDLRPLPVGAIRLCDLLGIDRGLLSRPSPTLVQLMPHGGPLIVAQLIAALASRGLHEDPRPDPRLAYPEARDEIEARALETLAHAPSPLAIDLLLDQSRRVREMGPPQPDAARETILSRLLRPALVVAMGAPNIGKSTLLNTLARAGVAIVADEPGTTRDHVGVLLDAAGLVVRYVDTPGLRSEGLDDIEREAIQASLEVARHADLLLLLTDSTAPVPTLAPDLAAHLAGRPQLVIGLRTDLGPPQTRTHLKVASLHTTDDPSTQRDVILGAIREALVPQEVLADPRPWRFF